jgi:hypothetical protein
MDPKAKTSAPRLVSATEYKLTYSFSFRIGNDGYAWNWSACWKDTYSKDGLGLPGHHGCGNKRVRANAIYSAKPGRRWPWAADGLATRFPPR